jgi:hypothetical protein
MQVVRESVDPNLQGMQVVVRIRPIDIAAVVSLLLHVLFFAFMPHPPAHEPMGPVTNEPLNVVLAPPQAEPAPVQVPQPPSVPAAPSRPLVARPQTPLAPRFPPPPIAMATPTPTPQPPVPVTPPEPQIDMMAAIEARRAQRREAESALARGAPSTATPTDAAARNLRSLSGREGVGGVFQILRKGVRSGEFSFNGFRNEGQKQWREVIEVDAGVGGDIELAMIRRMIELIRGHYNGDFQWESHRLGRVVVMSARPADQPGLEEFLMKEFFGAPPPVNARSRR